MNVAISLNQPYTLGAPPGRDGESVELRVHDDALQWRRGEGEWVDLVAIADITGPVGPAVEFQTSEGFIQWRLEGEADWNDLIAIAGLRGEDGTDGHSAYETWLALGNSGTEQDFINSLKLQGVEQQIEEALAPVLDDLAWVVNQTRLGVLHDAEQAGDRIGIVDGIVDPYIDASDVAVSTGFALTSGVYGIALVTPGNVESSAYAISGGNNSSGTPAANAFDDNTSTYWYSSQEGAAVNGAAYIGQNFPAAVNIDQVVFRTATASTLLQSPYTVNVQYSDNGSSWATATSGTIPAATNTDATITVPDVGAHTHWRVMATSSPGAGNAWAASEVSMRQRALPGNGTLRSAAFTSDVANPTFARMFFILLPPTLGDPVTLNTDLVASVSRDGGTTWTAIDLEAVETLADGSKLCEGFADISGQPSGSSMVYRHVTSNNKHVRISGTGLQWR